MELKNGPNVNFSYKFLRDLVKNTYCQNIENMSIYNMEWFYNRFGE